MSRPQVLLVASSSTQGWYLPEFAHPYKVLSPHVDLVIASPNGGATVLDPVSYELFKEDAYCMEFAATKSKLWLETKKLSDYTGRSKEFAAIFYIGGFGPMFDLVDNEVSTSLIREFHESGKIVATLCHGAAALLNAKLSDGTLLVKGENITGFSNAEEIAVDRQKDMPFHLETYLNNASEGGYKKAEKAWDPLVVVSEKKKLVTGQNPASAEGTGEALLKMIKESS